MNWLSAVVIPLVCVVLSIFVNILLAQAQILPPDMLNGDVPTILDVSVQFVFISAGVIASASIIEHKAFKEATPIPWFVTFAGLCVILGLLGSSQQEWKWVAGYPNLVRVWGPNIIGAVTIGYAVWKISQVKIR